MHEPGSDKRFALKFRQWEKVGEGLRESDRGQKCWVQLRRRESFENPVAECDSFAEEIGAKPLIDRWAEVDSYTAENLLVRLLGKSLTTNYWFMEPIEARATAEHLLDTFQMPRQVFTNVLSIDENGLTGWNSLTDLTFDAGLVIMDEHWAGLILVGEAR